MLAVILVATIVLVPGYLLCALAGYRENRFLAAVTFSLTIYLLALWGIRVFDGSVMHLGAALACTTAMLGIGLAYRRQRVPVSVVHVLPSLFNYRLGMGVVAAVVIGPAVYHLLFGVYDELPADFYQHIKFSHFAYYHLDEWGFTKYWDKLFGTSRIENPWYFLLAWSALVTGSVPIEHYPHTMIFTSGIFFLGVAALASRVYAAFDFDRARHQTVVALATLLVFLHFGTDVFSYFRYYSYAPAIINYVVFFAGVVFLLDLFERKGSDLRSVAVVLAAGFVTSQIHLQEGLFIMIAGFLLGVWWLISRIIHPGAGGRVLRIASVCVLVVLLLGAAAMYLRIRFGYSLRDVAHPKLLTFSVQYLGRFYILDPGYQFLQVLSYWGIWIYLLFFLFFKRYLPQPYLVLGMLSPLLTVFNPLFADVFVRLAQSHTLWRLTFFVPIHLAGALAILFLADAVRRHVGPMRLISAVAMVLSGILLLPSIGGITVNPYARVSLASVADTNRLEHWADLVGFLNDNNHKKLDVNRQLLTDPVTGYLVDGMTQYRGYNYKFLPSPSYNDNPFAFDSYEDFPLSRYSGQLIVVNLRNGGPSENGHRSGHWHRDVLRLTDYYPDELLPHLHAHPDRFEKLWENNRTYVFRIR